MALRCFIRCLKASLCCSRRRVCNSVWCSPTRIVRCFCVGPTHCGRKGHCAQWLLHSNRKLTLPVLPSSNPLHWVLPCPAGQSPVRCSTFTSKVSVGNRP